MNVNVRNLSHTYANHSARVQALRNVSLNIRAGEFVALIGPSGCGKSTLLRILAGLLRPQTGDVSLAGRTPVQAAAAKQVGWLAQNPALLPWRTVRANVELAQRINPQHGRLALSPDELLTLVGLDDFAAAYPFALSGGMQQRAALARTLALGADLWLMDEPFAALDELTREGLATELLDIWARFRPTVLWVTHHIYEAARLADRVLVMSRRPGQICAEVVVSLPRPRDEATPEFQRVVRALRRGLESPRGERSRRKTGQHAKPPLR